MTDVSKETEPNIARDVAAVAQRLPKYVKLAWLLVKDPDLTKAQRAALIAAIGYSISPIDAIPGIIPVIGQLDDLAVALFTMRWVLAGMPAERSAAYLFQSGLTSETLDSDLALVKSSGVKVLKKLVAVLGTVGLGIWAVAKATGRAFSKTGRGRK